MKKIPTQDLLFVGFQFFLLGIYFFPFWDLNLHHSGILKFLGALLATGGIGIVLFALIQLKTNLTAFPTPKANGTLIQVGLYKYMRHPIYGGIILSTIGIGLLTGSLWQLSIGMILWILFYFKSSYEERLLSNTYVDYSNYKLTTSRFFPFRLNK
jgi:protein-S-isoprenylcysteine O-methyltransferase Ste14